MDKVLVQMSRRAPGKDKTATPRKESDLPKVLSGMLGDTLTGAPLCAVIEIQTQKAATTAIFSIVLVRVTATTRLMLNITQATIFAAAVIFGQTYRSYSFAGAICRQILEEKVLKLPLILQASAM